MEMTKVHKIGGLRFRRVEPATAADDLPELEPPEDRLLREKTRIFSADAITLSHASAIEDVFDPALRAEHKDLTARATVYIMNLTVMVFALPVGLALLFMNILGGENLRTTAHVMALTGLFLAIGQMDVSVPFLVL